MNFDGLHQNDMNDRSHLLTTLRSSCCERDSRSGSWLAGSDNTLLFFRDIGADRGKEADGEGDLRCSNELRWRASNLIAILDYS